MTLFAKCTHTKDCTITTEAELLDTVRQYGDAQFLAGNYFAHDYDGYTGHMARGQELHRFIVHFTLFHLAVVPF